MDILLAALPKFLASNKKAQVVILGTGKASLEKQVAALDKTFKGQYKGVVKFSAPLAHIITAGADFFMVPSRFEPCGLIQLHAMQYGTVPLVSSTGGLVDTVKEGVTGFHMGALNPDRLTTEDAEAVATTMSRAAQVFGTPLFKEMVSNAISQDLSWAKPARKWEGILEDLVAGRVGTKKDTVKVPVANPIPGDKPPSPKLAGQEQAPRPTGAIRTLGLVSSTSGPSTSGASNGAAPSNGAPKAGAGAVPRTTTAAPSTAPSTVSNGAATAPKTVGVTAPKVPVSTKA